MLPYPALHKLPIGGNFMPKPWPNYTLEQLRTHSVQTFREGGGSRPDVLLIEIDGQRAVLKDHNRADQWFARLIGPILQWRECKALEKLDALECTPKLLAKPDLRSLLMSYHDSVQITQASNDDVNWPDFFQRFAAAIQQIHTAGVAHNDLRNPTNILVTPQGRPILVDMVACFCLGKNWNWPNQWLFKKFSQVDYSAIKKLKNKVAPELIDEADIDASDIAGRPGMWVRALGQAIRRLSRRFFTGSK